MSTEQLETCPQCQTLQEQITKLEAACREALRFLPNKHATEMIYHALREPVPPIRKLKGKIPHYQKKESA